MKILIDIPEEVYKASQIINAKYEDVIQIPLECISNGIPLPVGHGRLIDANSLYQSMYHEAFEVDSDLQKWDSGCWIRFKMFENCMDGAPTIIKEDLR